MCFISRPLLYLLLVLSGFPPVVLCAYSSYHEAAFVQFSINRHLGIPHQHRCGIPQGCPLSMLFITFLLLGWTRQMASFNIRARTLADDLFLSSTGTYALKSFVAAFNLTLSHMQDLGGRLSPHKSQLMATDEKHRSFLRR